MCNIVRPAVEMNSSAPVGVVLLLAARLIAISCGDQSVCTVTDEDSRPLCDGKVFRVYPPVTNESTSLYFAFMQSFSGGYSSSGGIPGVMVALDEINTANSSVLPGYTLHYALSDNAVRNLKFRTCAYTRSDSRCMQAHERTVCFRGVLFVVGEGKYVRL